MEQQELRLENDKESIMAANRLIKMAAERAAESCRNAFSEIELVREELRQLRPFLRDAGFPEKVELVTKLLVHLRDIKANHISVIQNWIDGIEKAAVDND
jgi:hypothetical protein